MSNQQYISHTKQKFVLFATGEDRKMSVSGGKLFHCCPFVKLNQIVCIVVVKFYCYTRYVCYENKSIF